MFISFPENRLWVGVEYAGCLWRSTLGSTPVERRGRKQDWPEEEAKPQCRSTTSTPVEKRSGKQDWADEKAKLQCRPNTSQLTPQVVLKLECVSELPWVGSRRPDIYSPTSTSHGVIWATQEQERDLRERWPLGSGVLQLRWSLKAVVKTVCWHTTRSRGIKPFIEGLSGCYITG